MNVVRNLVQRRRRLRTLDDLVNRGMMTEEKAGHCKAAVSAMPVSLTPQVAALIDPDDPDDPIARQFIPDPAENNLTHDELCDPIGDHTHSPVPGIVHRYPDRALLMPVHTCPVYCRFCFRRDAVGDGAMDPESFENALTYIENTPAIWEVILSGGDPLILSPARLAAIIDRLDRIDHVRTIRLHTRVPALDPDRINDDLIDALKGETPVWVVLHCNHAKELSPEARTSIARLVDAGFPMLSQTVLLRGVNDEPAAMESLMRALIECRIKPYYLHQGDKARGTSHFRTTLAAGRKLMDSLRGRLSGIAQPTYVLDIPGGFGKVPAQSAWIEPDSHGWRVRDPDGKTHKYVDEQAD